MSAGTSVTGGLGGVFYLILLAYSVIAKPYDRRKQQAQRHSPIWAASYALPVVVAVTVAILVILNLTNYEVVHTRDILWQELRPFVTYIGGLLEYLINTPQYKSIATYANESFNYLNSLVARTFPIINDDDIIIGTSSYKSGIQWIITYGK